MTLLLGSWWSYINDVAILIIVIQKTLKKAFWKLVCRFAQNVMHIFVEVCLFM